MRASVAGIMAVTVTGDNTTLVVDPVAPRPWCHRQRPEDELVEAL